MTVDKTRFHTIRTLLIDDDEDDFFLTKKTLKQTRTINASIEWVSNYDDALQKCRETDYDAVLIDYKIADRNGIDFIKESKKIPFQSPFILLTGIQDEQLGIKAIRLGAEDYLVKSEITPELLERSILYAIERFESRRTEQELMEKRILEQSERHFRSLIENSADGIALMNSKYHFTYVTPSIENILGYTPDQMLSLETSTLIHPDDLPKLQHEFKGIVKKRGGYTTSIIRCKHHNGSWRWIENTSSNMLHDPNIHSFVLNFRDVSSRVKLEQLKDEFLSIASHELKTPLTTIKGYIQLLEKYFQKMQDEKALRYIHQSDVYVDKLNQLISDLLDISRIQSGRMQLKLEETRLCTMIKKTVKALQYLSSKHKLTLTCDFDPKVFADQERIEQVLTNLIANAIKYSPNAEKIEIHLTKKNKFAVVSVRDFGIGISKAAQKRLFQRFYRVDKTAGQFSGLGIGLYISNEIIKRHQGNIWVESDEDQGATFYFTLPLQI